MLVARYTASASGIRPDFNDSYVYEVTETRSNGVYVVEIYSDIDFSFCSFVERTNLLTVEYLKVTNKVIDLSSMFAYCSNLQAIDTSNWDTSTVTNMYGMFGECASLISLDLSNCDTSKVTNMNSMFYGCKSLVTIDVSNRDTSKVTDMSYMFYNCNNLIDINGLINCDTSNVTDMSMTFAYCYSLKKAPVSNFNTSKVTNMYGMFGECTSLISLDLSNWDTSKVASIAYMFYNCNNLTLLDFSNMDVRSVIDAGSIFDQCSSLKTISLIYAPLEYVNAVASVLPSGCTIYVQEAKATNCNPMNGITYIDYMDDRHTITLPKPLLPGDELVWDEYSSRYIIKNADGTTLQTNIQDKIKTEVYNPIVTVSTNSDNVASISVNIYLQRLY